MNDKKIRAIIRATIAGFDRRTRADRARRKMYERYIKSEKWRRKRANKLKANPRCEMCDGKQGLQVHHLNYERFGRERWGDVITLCRSCHVVEHSSESDARKAEVFRFRDKQNRQQLSQGRVIVRQNRHRRLERGICARY